jgi:hypothetical protein
MVASDADTELLSMIDAHYYADPLGFVLDCFPWGEGSLHGMKGPDPNQRSFLEDLGREVKARKFDGIMPVLPIRMAISSGHGTGKSAMYGWLAWWILSTRPYSKGTVTAGTYVQLESRTWAAIQYWGKMCSTSHLFDILQSGIYSKTDPENWKLEAQSCKPENAQSFAGQHARNSSSFYIFDEASEVHDKVWETVDPGGLTDGEPIFIVGGQMVRNTGTFYESCFGKNKERWNVRRWDGRSSDFTNKALIEEVRRDWGEDSDMWRVRILGLPPAASELQYIDRNRVNDARKRPAPLPNLQDPLIAGFDVSGGGKAWNVIRFRRGYDMRSKPAIRIPGEKDPDRSMRIGLCAELLRDQRQEHKLSAMFVDTAFGAPIVQTLRGMGFTNVWEVAFGAETHDPNCANLRAYMYMSLKDWLLRGAIPDEDDLADQLCRPGFHIRVQGSKLVIESKADMQKRGESSPDDGDACALTFARPVAIARKPPPPQYVTPPRLTMGWS